MVSALEFAKGQTRISRLQAELNGSSEMPKSSAWRRRFPNGIAEQIAQVEAEQLQVRAGDMNKEKAYLGETKRQAQQAVALLADGRTRKRKASRPIGLEAERMRDLLQKGTVPSTRMTEARRNSLLSATQWLKRRPEDTERAAGRGYQPADHEGRRPASSRDPADIQNSR